MLTPKRYQVLGAMSGTSLDGVDAAVLDTDGVQIFGFGRSAYRPYSAAEQQVLRNALGKWGDGDVAQASELVETAHAALLSEFSDIDLVGFHGQTLAHDPRGRGTHQAGDGQVLADVLNVPVIWDFRSNDVQMGGEGAPLAPFYHFALAHYLEMDAPVAFLNLGGVGNLTWVDPSHKNPEDQGALLAFDTGPANAPINDFMRARLGLEYDKEGALGATGEIDDSVIEWLLKRAYFARIPPKSLDRDSFAGLGEKVAHMSDADGVATLTACAAAAVGQGLEHCPTRPTRLLVGGGGRYNKTMMQMISAWSGIEAEPVEAALLDGDMLEAQAFAYLAARVKNGLPTSCPSTTGVGAAIGGGILSTPRS